MKRIFKLTGALLLSVAVLACNKKNRNEEMASGPGYASGKVTNSAGQPLQGATIVISNTFSYNKNLTVTTNAKGEYSVKLPSGPGIGDWIAGGTYSINYNGKAYSLVLQADAHKVFSSSNGGVTNFVLKQTGREPSTSPGTVGSFYGGVISSYPGDGVDMSKVNITIKPLQPLIDGSTGQTITTAAELDGNLSWVVNVPIGKYEITAKQGNTPLFIRDYTEGIPDANVAKLVRDFMPCKVNGARYWIKIDLVREP